MKKSVFAGSLCVVLALWASTALAADKWMGTWKLNVGMSKFAAGQAPKSQTIKFEATADGTKLSSDGMSASGESMKSTYTSKWDGKDVAWTGNPDADTASPKRVSDHTYTNTWKKGGKPTIDAKVVVSADGKTLTVTQTGKNAKGEAVSSTGVYEKQ
jgi:hypothetical protein